MYHNQMASAVFHSKLLGCLKTGRGSWGHCDPDCSLETKVRLSGCGAQEQQGAGLWLGPGGCCVAWPEGQPSQERARAPRIPALPAASPHRSTSRAGVEQLGLLLPGQGLLACPPSRGPPLCSECACIWEREVCNPPASASRVAGITSVRHCARQVDSFLHPGTAEKEPQPSGWPQLDSVLFSQMPAWAT